MSRLFGVPQGLKSLIEESFAMHDRISKLDRAMSKSETLDAASEPMANPVAQQVGMLERAFAKLS